MLCCRQGCVVDKVVLNCLCKMLKGKAGFCCFCRTLGISSGLDEVVGCLLGIHSIMKIKKSDCV